MVSIGYIAKERSFSFSNFQRDTCSNRQRGFVLQRIYGYLTNRVNKMVFSANVKIGL